LRLQVLPRSAKQIQHSPVQGPKIALTAGVLALHQA
jgi:hypothetical protein